MISSKQADEERQNLAVVTQLNMDDVLMGRGAPAIDNEGNVRLRRIVHSRRAEYLSVSKRQAKDQIAREIVSYVHSRGGRFLRKLEEREEARNHGVAEGANVWKIVDRETVLTKVKQALRDRSTEDEDPRPRKRKRVNRGNLVPEEETDSDRPEQKMEQADAITGGHQQAISNLLLRQHLVGSLGDAESRRNFLNPGVSSQVSAEPTEQGQLDAILRQIRQAEGHSSIPAFNRADSLLRLPLSSSSYLFPGLQGGSYYGEHSGNLAASRPFPSFAATQRVQVDPLLGSVSSVHNALTGLGRALRTNEASMGMGRSDLPLQGMDPFRASTRCCEGILLGAFLNTRFPSSLVPGDRLLTLSLFEASLLFVLCEYGLPLLPTSQAVQSLSESTEWSWALLAEKNIHRSIRSRDSRSSYVSLARFCYADAETVDRTSALASSLARNPDELGRFTVMLLAKMHELSEMSTDTSIESSHSRLVASMNTTGASGVESGRSRESSSRAEGQNHPTYSVTREFLQQWASRLRIDVEGGPPVALSSEDLRSRFPNDKGFFAVASLDAQQCGRIFSMIGTLTRLRHILLHHDEINLLSALSASPQQYKPLSPVARWWTDAEVQQRDLWLIKSAIENGVSTVLDGDASTIGAPLRTLREASVTVVEVESRLEQLCVFLISHFDAQSRARVAEERVVALTALLR